MCAFAALCACICIFSQEEELSLKPGELEDFDVARRLVDFGEKGMNGIGVVRLQCWITEFQCC